MLLFSVAFWPAGSNELDIAALKGATFLQIKDKYKISYYNLKILRFVLHERGLK